MNNTPIPNMMFHPTSPQEVLDVLHVAMMRFGKLASASTVEQLRDAVRLGYCPAWFVISDDPNLDYYVYHGEDKSPPRDYSDFNDYFKHYPVISITDFLNDRVTKDGKVRHVHADLIEWFMASKDNEVEFKSAAGGWTRASTPNWRTETEYRKVEPEIKHQKRHQHDVLVEWANDQSLVLQGFIQSEWRDIKDGDLIDPTSYNLRIKPSNLVELEKQALAIIANPALLEMIQKLNN